MSAPGTPAVTGLLLAAGAGRRFGGPKGVVVRDGMPWVVRSALILLEGGCGDVVVVTGARAKDVESLVEGCGDERICTVRCGTWSEGMGESLSAGLMALATRGRLIPTQALVHLVDLPDVGADVVARVLSSARMDGRAGPSEARSALVRAAYGGVPGHPVLIGSDHWDGVLQRTHGDIGAKAYLRRARPTLVECADLANGRDVDINPDPH
ncbi:MAG: nucleotidyltransferase family protein [Ornithinimicrobium sp.]|uniref:nucleotidyltransferase family protein n=1 Tax=Ornithinimicrobium sp. TaxID=1977084 RepID=UPI0026DF4403|nr:nucleotidyltransferase family protein [Ornithinimicrobium sp.]MDO5738609.1 nucleotidyltransferase family protein [Ornithinimicrobium sp.]